MPDDLESLRDPSIAEVVLQLEALLSQSHRAFLFGAGCSLCAGLPLTDKLTDIVSKELGDGLPATTLKAVQSRYAASEAANIEDFMSEIVDLLSLAERRARRDISDPGVSYQGRDYSAEALRDVLHSIKRSIAKAVVPPKSDLTVHQAFVRAVHRTLQSGKSTTARPVDYFVLNYDTLIEDALGLEQVEHSDGLRGSTTGWWDASVFDSGRIPTRVFKLHGSVDWCLLDGERLPRRIRGADNAESETGRVMIWPAATKYRETQLDPYAQMLNHFRKVLRPGECAELVLIICGYSFGDSHINMEIDAGLRDSGRRLTILAFTSDDEPNGQLKEWLDDIEVAEQIQVFANRGFFHGAIRHKTEADLPWWKFEVFTRLLGGER